MLICSELLSGRGVVYDMLMLCVIGYFFRAAHMACWIQDLKLAMLNFLSLPTPSGLVFIGQGKSFQCGFFWMM
ncbi:hypothetical protein EFK68_03440 [Pseudomonas aeruginosa]|nr:hypothetical protein EFK68_03440 [Pseudomonas aeruginosa]